MTVARRTDITKLPTSIQKKKNKDRERGEGNVHTHEGAQPKTESGWNRTDVWTFSSLLS
jgi:hypothetical protein